MTQLQKDARSISSGTIAGLIGSNRYIDIDEREREFIAFVDQLPIETQNRLNWIQAWKWFWTGNSIRHG